MTAKGAESFFDQTRSLSWPFWAVNIMEMVERLAFYGVRVVIPIYIAQADEASGLHFTQSEKGFIFMWWALVQSALPERTAAFARLMDVTELSHNGATRLLWEAYHPGSVWYPFVIASFLAAAALVAFNLWVTKKGGEEYG